MEETDKLKRKTIISTLSLFFQSGYSAFLGLIANLIITILLSPAIYGIYLAVLSMISILNYFSDMGLAASLIQKKEINTDDVKTAFTVQQILIITLITLGFFSTPFIMNFYKLPIEGKYLFWSLLISFFLSSLKTIPSVFLERKIQFQKIVLVQMVESTVFYITVSVLAYLGYGLMSFAYAVIFRSIVGVILIYSFSFWLPQIGISRPSLKSLLSFGLPFQASSFLALFKDDLINLYLAKVLGFETFSYIGWAKKWAEAPIRIIMDNISRVMFPVFSRIQTEKEKLSRVIEKIFRYQTTVLAPTIVGFALIMYPLTLIIPRYSKWQPALPLFYIFCLSAIFSSYSTPIINLFNALGKAKISFIFMFIWTVMIWVLTPIMTKHYGYFGFPIVQLIIASSFIFVIFIGKKMVTFSFLRSIYRQIISSLVMAIVVLFIYQLPLGIIYRLVLMTAGGFLSYIILLFLFKINLLKEVRELLVN